MNTELPVKKEFDYNIIGSWKNGNPFTIFYVYPKDDAPFIIKGGANDVKKWMDKYNTPCIYYYAYFHKGVHRGGWCSNIKNVTDGDVNLYFSNEYKPRTTRDYGEYRTGKIKIEVYKNNERIFIKKVRRIPRSWIKELDKYI